MHSAYRISVNIPVGMEDRLMDAIDEVMEPLYPGYRRCFCKWNVTGTWIPVEGSHPYIGEIGKAEVCEEVRIEFAVKEKDLRAVVERIEEVHPYDEPAVDVIPLIPWKDVIRSSSD